MKKILLVLFLGCAAFGLVTGAHSEQAKGKVRGSVTIDKVDGLYATDSIYAGIPITFHIRFTNNTSKTILASTCGLKVYSPDGIKWDTTYGYRDEETMPSSVYDGGHFINTFSLTGSGADTVGFGGFKIKGTGMPDGFDKVVYYVQIGPIAKKYSGKKICVDSTFYPPGGAWLWSLPQESFQPTWYGPYCYTVVDKKPPAKPKTGNKKK